MASKQRKRRRKRRAVKKPLRFLPFPHKPRRRRPEPEDGVPPKAGVPVFSESASSAPCGPPLPVSLPPTVLRGVVESQLSEAVNAPVTIESLSVNPFTLGHCRARRPCPLP